MKKIKTAKIPKKPSQIFEDGKSWCHEMNRRARDVTQNVDEWKQLKEDFDKNEPVQN